MLQPQNRQRRSRTPDHQEPVQAAHSRLFRDDDSVESRDWVEWGLGFGSKMTPYLDWKPRHA